MSGEPPYRRIVNEIRDRIARGDLSPGDRVPSIRAITQTWDVAMATATKVIVELKHEGLVHTHPGSGTVVADGEADDSRATADESGSVGAGGRAESDGGHARRGAEAARGGKLGSSADDPVPDSGDADDRSPAMSAGQRAVELNRRRIVRAAVALADTDGLDMVTMRRVAAELGASTMSLYRHVVSKDDLVLMMVDEVFGEESLPDSAGAPLDWRYRLEVAARLMWAIFRRHPWAAEELSLTRPQLLPNLLPFAEWVLAGLRELDMDVNDTMFAYLAVIGHVRGTAISLDSEMRLEQDTGMTPDEWMDAQERPLLMLAGANRFPSLEWVSKQDFDFSLDGVFEYGLQRILDGIAVRVEEVIERKQVDGTT